MIEGLDQTYIIDKTIFLCSLFQPFFATAAYCTKQFRAITAYCTKPVLSNKPASRGGLIAQNSLPENIARWSKWVLEMD